MPIRMNPIGIASLRTWRAWVVLLAQNSADQTKGGHYVNRSLLRRFAAVLAMVAGFGFATATTASAQTSADSSSAVVVDNSNASGPVIAQLADWWW
jgi:hypothetical protein